MKSTPKYDAGVDIKYSITNNLTVDLQLIRDFAQVEADDQKINPYPVFSLLSGKEDFFFRKKPMYLIFLSRGIIYSTAEE